MANTLPSTKARVRIAASGVLSSGKPTSSHHVQAHGAPDMGRMSAETLKSMERKTCFDQTKPASDLPLALPAQTFLAQGQAQSISGWPDSPQAQERVEAKANQPSPLCSVLRINSKLEREVGLAGDCSPLPGWVPGDWIGCPSVLPKSFQDNRAAAFAKPKTEFLAGIRACDVGGACLSLSPLTTSCSLPLLALIPSLLPHSSLHVHPFIQQLLPVLSSGG